MKCVEIHSNCDTERSPPKKIYINHKCSACLKKDWKILQIKIIDLVDRPFKESCFFSKKTPTGFVEVNECRTPWHQKPPNVHETSKNFVPGKALHFYRCWGWWFFFGEEILSPKDGIQKKPSSKERSSSKSLLIWWFLGGATKTTNWLFFPAPQLLDESQPKFQFLPTC